MNTDKTDQQKTFRLMFFIGPICVNLWLRIRFIFGHLIIYRFQGALEYRAVCRVRGRAQLRHNARARDSQRFKLRAAGALFERGSSPQRPSIRYCLLPFEYLFRLPGQSVAIPSHNFHLAELINVPS
jgi:hypothetical protein